MICDVCAPLTIDNRSVHAYINQGKNIAEPSFISYQKHTHTHIYTHTLSLSRARSLHIIYTGRYLIERLMQVYFPFSCRCIDAGDAEDVSLEWPKKSLQNSLRFALITMTGWLFLRRYYRHPQMNARLKVNHHANHQRTSLCSLIVRLCTALHRISLTTERKT